ncbi:hypothetical protein BVY04_02810 [bacterium M21]|nr:hypothetical protein BVY04_02810 [bacterium M21]
MEVSHMKALFSLLLVSTLILTAHGKPKRKMKPVPQDRIDQIDAAVKQVKAQPTTSKRRILLFSYSEGFFHQCIPTAAKALDKLGAATGAYTVEHSTDMNVFTTEKLADFDAIIFNNTTHLSFKNHDHRKALMAFIKSGKGIIGIHAASDSFGTWPEASAMIGGMFDLHPWTAKGTWKVKIDEPEHPLNQSFDKAGFAIKDEIYQFKAPYSRDNLRVLLSLDMSDERNQKVDKKKIHRTDNDFAISWVRSYDKGRVFYCSLGHNHEVYWNVPVLQHYLLGIQYALGDLKIDDAPVGAPK